VYTAMLGVALLDVLLVTFTRVKGEMMVERHPIITNALQGAVLVFAGYQPPAGHKSLVRSGVPFRVFETRPESTPRVTGACRRVHVQRLTKHTLTGLMQLAGDTVAQMYENRQKGLTTLRPNISRLRKAALVGVVNVGLWPYYWYREYRLRFPCASLSSTLSRNISCLPSISPLRPFLHRLNRTANNCMRHMISRC